MEQIFYIEEEIIFKRKSYLKQGKILQKSFGEVAATEKHPFWAKLKEKKGHLYERKIELRSPFERDYARLLHSLAYRKLKHKTKVFYNIENDYICTRMEHVAMWNLSAIQLLRI